MAAGTVRQGVLAAAISKMAFGNRLGVCLDQTLLPAELFGAAYGSFVLEIPAAVNLAVVFGEVPFARLGITQERAVLAVNGQELSLEKCYQDWERPLAKVFPTRPPQTAGDPPPVKFVRSSGGLRAARRIARPRVIIPVFPGTNCEYDSARAFERAGGLVATLVIRNLTPAAIEESVTALVAAITRAQIIMLPGGFSAGDEPDGSGKFIAALFRNPRITEAVNDLLNQRDGLILGICNGFQALIKLGLVPYGKIVDLTPDSPTLTFNQIGRHVSRLVRTKVASNQSPWFNNAAVGDIHTVAVSHGEGRFAAGPEVVAALAANGQIATQYVDFNGNPSGDIDYNPNGSAGAVEAITSSDGRILGKMAHSERAGKYVALNVPGEKEQGIFAAGIRYFG